MNLPNFLTLSRFLLAAVFGYCILQVGLGWVLLAIVVFTIAALTDYLDGYFAKKHQLTTGFGKIMDPIADKFLTLTAFWIFVYLGLVEAWMVLIISLREVAVTVSRLQAIMQGHVLAAERAGKIKTVTQMITIFLVLAFLLLREGARTAAVAGIWNSVGPVLTTIIQIFMTIAMLLTVISGVMYFQSKRQQFDGAA